MILTILNIKLIYKILEMESKILKPSNYNYFPEKDRIIETNDKNSTNSYEFLTYHPVCVTSEMVGTSIEELLMHNFPTKRSWECSRLCSFPQELIVRLDHRSHMKFILLKAKINRPIQELDIFIGDGIHGNFNDVEYRKVAIHTQINDEGVTIKVDGIGNYLKLAFIKQSIRNQDNPFGQVSLSQLKIFGKQINHLIYYDPLEDDLSKSSKETIDTILINLGLPLNDPFFIVNDQNYEIAPVDEQTKITLKDLLNILNRADKCNKILINISQGL
jgi:centrosomal protein CEP104